MKTHILLGGIPVCGSPSMTAVANSADCKLCNSQLEKLVAMLLQAVATENKQDREQAIKFAKMCGYADVS